MKFKVILFLLVLNLLSCSTVNHLDDNAYRNPAQITLQDNLTNADKIKILIAIHKEIPELFADATRYDIDLLKILDDQAELQKLLATHPEFMKKWDEKKFIEMKISVKAKNAGLIESKVISESAVEEWRNELIAVAKDLLNERKNLNTTAQVYLQNLNGRNSSGFLNGLILNLPKDKQVTAREYQKKAEWIGLEKYLDQHLPATLVNFKSTPPETDLTKDALIKKWVSIASIEKKAGPVVDLAILSMNKNLDLRKLIPELEQLTRQDLENMGDRDYQQNAFSKIFNKENVATPAFYERYLKHFQSQTEVVSVKASVGDKISIKEQNPNVAIFRGCTGGDCSSQYSFPYPNDPNERVFFIYDNNKSLKGYVSATIVDANQGEKSLYVITISGNRVNSEDTELILQAMYKERAALGVKNIVLPSKDNISGLINFPLIRAVYEQSSYAAESTQIVYEGQSLRKQIESFSSDYNTAQYDFMEKNNSGVVYVPKKSREIPIEVTVSSLSDENKFIKQGKMDAMGFIEFHRALLKSKRSAIIKELDASLFFNNDEARAIEDMMDVINGKNVVTTNEIEEVLRNFKNRFSINDNQIKNIKDNYLFNAYLRARDAGDEPYYGQNVKRLLDDFKYSSKAPIVGRDAAIYEIWEKTIIKDPRYETLKVSYIEAIKKENALDLIQADIDRFLIILKNEKIDLPVDILRRVINIFPRSKRFVEQLVDMAVSENKVEYFKYLTPTILQRYYPEVFWKELANKILESVKVSKSTEGFAAISLMLNSPHAKDWKDETFWKQVTNKMLDSTAVMNTSAGIESIGTMLNSPYAQGWKDEIFWKNITDKMLDSVKVSKKKDDFLSVAKMLNNLYSRDVFSERFWQDLESRVLEFVKSAKSSEELKPVATMLSYPYAQGWSNIAEKVLNNSIAFKSNEPISILCSGFLSKPQGGKWNDLVYKTIDSAIPLKDGWILVYVIRDVIKNNPDIDPTKLVERIFDIATTMKERDVLRMLNQFIDPNKVSKEFFIKYIQALVDAKESTALHYLAVKVANAPRLMEWGDVIEKLSKAAVEMESMVTLKELAKIPKAPAYLNNLISLYEKNYNWNEIRVLYNKSTGTTTSNPAKVPIAPQGFDCHQGMSRFLIRR